MARPFVMAWVAAGALVLTGAAAPARANVRIVTVSSLAFAPAPEGLKVGDTVMWVNLDLFEHTVTARNGAFDVDLKPGAKASIVLKQPGSVDYYCRFHPGMTGKMVVGPR